MMHLKKICDIVAEKCERMGKINKEYFLEKLQWKYGFIITKIECKNTINL